MTPRYFQRAPHRPITVLLFSDESTYRRYAEQLFFDRDVSRFGYFKPGRCTILANLAWGDGPLLHELTHALMYFDFPEAAVWLREGLASLHEASSLVGEERRWALEGKVNWRLDVLRHEVQAGRLRSLRDLIRIVDFGGEDEAVNCAQARYFCLFLQRKDALVEIYQRYRATRSEDPRGEKALLLAFPSLDWRALDAEFNRWVMSLSTNDPAQEAGLLPGGRSKTGSARLRSSRNRGKMRLGGSFALARSGSEMPPNSAILLRSVNNGIAPD